MGIEMEEQVMVAKIEKLRAEKAQISVDVERMQIEMDVLRARLRESSMNLIFIEARISQVSVDTDLMRECIAEKQAAVEMHKANQRAAEAHTALVEMQTKREQRWWKDDSGSVQS